MKSFGANFAGRMALADAPRINERDYGFPAAGAFVAPFYIPYYVDEPSNLACFAASPDYHALARRAFAACEDCAREAGGYFRGFADVSPFAEVPLAAMCSLGVVGDHGMLITKLHSSFVVLGEIVSDLPEICEALPPAEGAIRECEHCGACRRACPTGGLDDRSLCISSVTQKKGELTEGEKRIIRENRSPWGCDRCALACPHTKRAKAAGTLETDVEYFRQHRLGYVTAADVAAMSDEEYASYTFSWRKREVLIRNLQICADCPENGTADGV